MIDSWQFIAEFNGCISSGYRCVIVLSLLDFISSTFFGLCKNNIDRTPSHFTSKIQSLSVKGSSTAVASIGFIFVGNSAVTPTVESTADLSFILWLEFSLIVLFA